jgi:ribonuclease E
VAPPRAEHGERDRAQPLQQRQPDHADQPRAEVGDQGGEERPVAAEEVGPDGQPRRRRRGRRGGRRGRRGRGGELVQGGETQGDRPFEAEPIEPTQPAFADRFGSISSDFDEIDTTPRVDEPAHRGASQRPALVPDLKIGPADEIDTTPRPRERPKEAAANETLEEPALQPPMQPIELEDEDPNRPKRSGWWQRKSFFG